MNNVSGDILFKKNSSYIQYGNEDKEKSREIEQTLDICVYFFSKMKKTK